MIVTRALLATLLLVFTGCQQLSDLRSKGFESIEEFSQTPLQARLKLADLDIQFDQESFIDSIYTDDVMIVKLFLAAGMDPNTRAYNSMNRVSRTGYSGNGTVLHYAAHLYNVPIVEALLDAGADVDIKDDYGNRPIDYVRNKKHDVYELLEYGRIKSEWFVIRVLQEILISIDWILEEFELVWEKVARAYRES